MDEEAVISEDCRKSFETLPEMPKETQELMRKAWYLYERCRRYNGRLVHDVNCLAGRLLNFADCLRTWWSKGASYSGKLDVNEERKHCEELLRENWEDGLKRFGSELP